ncbi:MAG: squalene/phytoene synthase family protein [Candidatus Hodarchaeota archaeon]
MKDQNANQFDFVRKPNYQQLLTNPIMDIAARFWEDERYEAGKVCYQSMRVIDDLIDNCKAATPRILEIEKQKLVVTVNDWVKAINSHMPCDFVQKQLIETITRFQIPMWPWQRFAKSMIYDIHHYGFRTFPIFLQYAEGAAVAPAAIFMHLCGTVKDNDHYGAPRFDIRKAARPIALFAYLVHIIRDFQKDQNSNLNYFADDLISENELSPLMLREIADGNEINTGFRNLMERYYALTEDYSRKARRTIDKIGDHLQPRYRLSLEIVYNLYRLIFERIDVSNGRFTTRELTPSPEEVKNRIDLTISSFEPAK